MFPTRLRLSLLLLFLTMPAKGGSLERFGAIQYAMIPTLALGNLLLLEQPPPERARWTGGLFLDNTARNALRLDSKSGRDALALTGDALLFLVTAYPIAVDALADTWLSKKDSDTAGQLSLIATQALLTTGFLRLVSKVLVGRERPFQQECASNPGYDTDCGKETSRTSFFSGHASLSFTGAGLICAAHQQFELFGGMVPCYAALGAAAVVSLTRVMADKHYVTDTLFGALVGFASGFGIPKLLHFRSDARSTTSLTPSVGTDRVGVTFGMVF